MNELEDDHTKLRSDAGKSRGGKVTRELDLQYYKFWKLQHHCKSTLEETMLQLKKRHLILPREIK